MFFKKSENNNEEDISFFDMFVNFIAFHNGKL